MTINFKDTVRWFTLNTFSSIVQPEPNIGTKSTLVLSCRQGLYYEIYNLKLLNYEFSIECNSLGNRNPFMNLITLSLTYQHYSRLENPILELTTISWNIQPYHEMTII